MLDGLDIEDGFAELVFGERSRIAVKVIAGESDRPLIGVAGARSFRVEG